MTREQPLVPTMGRKGKHIAFSIGSILLLLAIGIVAYYIYKVNYVPPFDLNAKAGEPEVSEDFLYSGFTTDYGYEINMAANLYRQENGDLYIYFTNVKENKVNLMLEIQDKETGAILYKSGVIKPGEYIEKLSPNRRATNVAREAQITVYAFEPETYHSEGSSYLTVMIQAW